MAKNKNCVLVLENLRSVENTASIFRTAEGLGVFKIILVGTTPAPVDRFKRKRKDFAKVSLGAEEMMPWEYYADSSEPILTLKAGGFQIISLELTHDSTPLQKASAGRKFALIVGNEVEGVSSYSIRSSDLIVEIPMLGRKESLNVSVSTGIALYELLQ